MAKEIPYSPMQVRKHVTFQRMQEILAKHVKRVGPMKWKKAGEHTIAADGYAILRLTEDGKPTGRFMLFRIDGDKRKVLGAYETADLAREACERHRLGQKP